MSTPRKFYALFYVDVLDLVSVVPNLQTLTLEYLNLKFKSAAQAPENYGSDDVVGGPPSMTLCNLSLRELIVDELALWVLLDRLGPVVDLYGDKLTVHGSQDVLYLRPNYITATRTLELSAVKFLTPHPARPSMDVLLSFTSGLKKLGIICDLQEANEVDTLCDLLETKGANLECLCLECTGVTASLARNGHRYPVAVDKDCTSFSRLPSH
ncbi:hypothetical protein EUX98_g8193 [Antrodiella citrinella]|uniref:Uncharacterized protein n=1 Tax=Antrodiella citrinella TaxID=2447956 RepID=A0A4S4MH86_9APHY|nr:hypothetical protein EUX98_g8193 [Antrodiella citrinella]